MRKLLFVYLLLFSFMSNALETKKVLPSDSHLAWAEAEIGALFHFDVVNFVPEYNWRNWGTHPPVSVFNPGKLDTDQWIRSAKSAGAKYAVLVAKHCSGFSLWPTEAHDYSVRYAPWKNGKGDIVKDFIASCKKYGLRPGIYASASANGFLYVDNPGKVKEGGPVSQDQYNKIVEKQLTELWSNYGDLFEIWFDGGVLPKEKGGPDLAPLLKKLQPDAVVFQGPADANNLIRWVGNEEGRAPYPNWSRADFTTSATGTIDIKGLNGNPEGSIWCPGEADFPLRTGWQGGWFWKADEQKLLTTKQLLESYYTSVGRNSNMLLGIVVDTSGLVPQEDVNRLKDFGDQLQRVTSNPVGKITRKTSNLISLNFGVPKEINQIIISENIEEGEKIREYVIEVWTNGKWIKVCSGQSVGHKRIQKFEKVKTSRIRLNITKTAGQPSIKVFSAYNV